VTFSRIKGIGVSHVGVSLRHGSKTFVFSVFLVLECFILL